MSADGLFLRAIGLRAGFAPEGYLARLAVVRQMMHEPLRLHAPITLLAGENGAGKSTLLEAIAVACGFNPEGGTRNFSFRTRDTHSALGELIVLTRGPRRPRDGFFLRAESFYNVASEVDRLYEGEGVPDFYGGESLHEQSHGESFLAVAMNRFGPGGLYLLDEPEAALSPMRQMALLARFDQLARAGAQLIAATHSPILMACPNTELYWLDDQGARLTDYRDTPHYQIMHRFLESPERMLRMLEDD